MSLPKNSCCDLHSILRS